MNYRNNRGFDPEQFFGPDGPFGPRGPLGPGGIFGPQGPLGTGGAWPFFGGGDESGWGPRGRQHGHRGPRRGPGVGGPRRAPRGAVRNAILELLQGGPMNGYELMQGIAEATEGAWTPSSGAVYPALSQLEDEGLITQVEVDGRKAYELTESGRGAAANGPSPLAGFTAEGGEGQGHRRGHGSQSGREGRRGEGQRGRGTGGKLWKALGGLAMATQAVGQSGDDVLAREAASLLDQTRRDLYRMLAESEVAKDDADDRDPYADTAKGYDDNGKYDDKYDDGDEITEGELLD